MGAVLSAFALWLRPYIATAVLTIVGYMFSDVILTFVEQVINHLASSVSNTAFTLPTVDTSLASLPPEMLGILKRIRVDDALSVIVTAVGVRTAAGFFTFIRQLRRGGAPS